jgi:hypothetical protein
MNDADDALAIGMDSECMRICALIDEIIASRGRGSYGKGQRLILRRLKDRIYDGATIYPFKERP